jgi:MoxR-like ATPase
MDAELANFQEKVGRLRAEVGTVLVGQREVVDGVIACLVADGHCLLEGVPGLGKTLLVRTLAQALSLTDSRIQFTPDLMPADILGTHILEEDDAGRRHMSFRKGPIFTQFLLADEINRATPKTQSALLEAMQERQVTVGGVRHELPPPFFVMATQNPLEQEGTYPLPEAQLDRFFYKIVVPFPSLDELVEVMARTTGNRTPAAKPVLSAAELAELRRIVRSVPVAPEVMRYAMRLVLATQPGNPHTAKGVTRFIKWGASPRGAQTLILGGRVQALLDGRSHVAIRDIRAVAPHALRHRIGASFEADAEGLTADDLVKRLLDEVPEVEGRVARELRA